MAERERAELPRGPVRRALDRASIALALVAGLVLVAIALMSAVSIVSRALFSMPIQGDYELVQQGCAIFVACCLPIAQLRYANIIVDFFTVRASARTRARLDALGALVVALVMSLVAWRSAIGLVAMYESGQTSTILGIPTWYTYIAMLPGLVLCAIVSFFCVAEKWVEGQEADGAH
jgi:TRAP-type C4-dicarboxylate transport system permease small subunit